MGRHDKYSFIRAFLLLQRIGFTAGKSCRVDGYSFAGNKPRHWELSIYGVLASVRSHVLLRVSMGRRAAKKIVNMSHEPLAVDFQRVRTSAYIVRSSLSSMMVVYTKSRAKYNRIRLRDTHNRGKMSPKRTTMMTGASHGDDLSLAWSTSKSRLTVIPRSFRSLMYSIGSSSTTSPDGDVRDAPAA